MKKTIERRPIVAVVGSCDATDEVLQFSDQLGRELMRGDFNVVCGGLSGVMEAVCKGAFDVVGPRSGRIIGIIPSNVKGDANPYVDIVIPSGIGFARNFIVALTGDALVALNGGSGTLSEIAYGWQFGKPIIAVPTLGGWSKQLAGSHLDGRHPQPIYSANTPKEILAILNKVL